MRSSNDHGKFREALLSSTTGAVSSSLPLVALMFVIFVLCVALKYETQGDNSLAVLAQTSDPFLGSKPHANKDVLQKIPI